MTNDDILKLAKKCGIQDLTQSKLEAFATALTEPLEARVADYRERYENCMIEVATRGLELAQQEARIAELEDALKLIAQQDSFWANKTGYTKGIAIAKEALANKSNKDLNHE